MEKFFDAPGAQSVTRSAADLAWLMTSPEVSEVTGAYFSGRRRHSSSKESYDQARATELWEVSTELATAAG